MPTYDLWDALWVLRWCFHRSDWFRHVQPMYNNVAIWIVWLLLLSLIVCPIENLGPYRLHKSESEYSRKKALQVAQLWKSSNTMSLMLLFYNTQLSKKYSSTDKEELRSPRTDQIIGTEISSRFPPPSLGPFLVFQQFFYTLLLESRKRIHLFDNDDGWRALLVQNLFFEVSW